MNTSNSWTIMREDISVSHSPSPEMSMEEAAVENSKAFRNDITYEQVQAIYAKMAPTYEQVQLRTKLLAPCKNIIYFQILSECNLTDTQYLAT